MLNIFANLELFQKKPKMPKKRIINEIIPLFSELIYL